MSTAVVTRYALFSMPRLRRAGRRLLLLAFVSALSLAVGYEGYAHHKVGLVIAAIPLLIAVLTNPRLMAVLAVGLLPFGANLPGITIPDASPGLPDVFLVLALAGLAFELIDNPKLQDRLRDLKPLLRVMALWIGGLLVLFAATPAARSIFKISQRIELVVVAAIVGGLLLAGGRLILALRIYVASSSVLAMLYIVGVGDQVMQKNPAGQMVTNAMLLALAIPRLGRARLAALPVLAVGLFATQSRGAILALGAGLVVLLLFQAGANRRRTLLQLVPLTALLVVGFVALPQDAQTRTTTVSGTQDYALKVRSQYRADALTIYREHRNFGVGTGRYLAGDKLAGTQTTDPHQVLYLTLAEGGRFGLVNFALLTLGTLAVVLFVARRRPLTPVAVAVQTAILLHGFADVYWVRATPVLGWVLLGVAVSQRAERRDRTEALAVSGAAVR